MRAPISVVISDGTTSRHVTKKVRDLRFSKSAYGGDVSLSCRVLLSKRDFTDLGPNADITVYDHDGSELWSGNIDNPGDSDGPAGELLELTAFGGSARLTYVTEPLAPVVTDLEPWERVAESDKRAEVSGGERSNGSQVIRLAAKSTGTIPSGWICAIGLRGALEAGMVLGRLAYTADSTTEADAEFWTFGGAASTATSASGRFDNSAMPTSPTRVLDYLGSGTGKVGSTSLFPYIGMQSKSSATGNDKFWLEIWNIVYRQALKNITGSAYPFAGLDRDYVLAHEVITHIVGHGMIPGADKTKASVATTSFQIDALNWLDGINVADALEELRLFEPDLFWTLYGDTFKADLWTNLSPRYVINNRLGGITFAGDDRGTLCNRITVQWTNERGRERTTIVEDNSVALDYTRDAEPIQLADGTGSIANAQRAGEKALELINKQPISGKAVIRKPIRDQITGEMVKPHQIKPDLVLHQETGRVYRMTEVDYSDPDGSALLSLGRPVRTTAQWLARNERRMRRQKRH